MMLHDFPCGGMIFQFTVHFIRKTLPAVLTENLREFPVAQLMDFLTDGNVLEVFVQLSLGALCPDADDLLFRRLLRLVVAFDFGFVERLFRERLQLFRFPSEKPGLHFGYPFLKQGKLRLRLHKQRDDFLFVELFQFFNRIFLQGTHRLSLCRNHSGNSVKSQINMEIRPVKMTVENF